MIRITYSDRVYTLLPDDDVPRPVRFASKELGTWVAVLNTAGFKIEVLSGGTKAAAAVAAMTETEKA